MMFKRFSSSNNPSRPLATPPAASSSDSLASALKPLPSSSRVVIVGGGVVGCSVAYHLSKLGWGSDTIILESGQLGCGTTWHAAGLVGQMRATASETRLSGVYGAQLYARLEAETGVATGFRQSGSVTIARTAERMTLLRRQAARARAFNIEAELISAEEAQRRWPLMRHDDLLGGLWLPGDGSITSTDLTASLAAGARQGGVVVHERTRVLSMEVQEGSHERDRRVRRVLTDRGGIECEVVINCGGQWARQLGLMAAVSVPLHSAEHFYVVSEPLSPAVPTSLPVLRDPDSLTYYREWSGGLVMGGFERRCKPCFHHSVPDKFEFALLPEDWNQFEPLMEGALHRVPALANAGVRMVNGPESFTPDNSYLLGEAPNCRRFYVAAGMNSSGIASAGGAGKALADWVVNDKPMADLWSVDIRRFASWHAAPRFLQDRVVEVLGLHYAIPWPQRELTSARRIRRSPFYQLLLNAGAQYGSSFGWERANYFLPLLHPSSSSSSSSASSSLPSDSDSDSSLYSFGRQRWFEQVGAEVAACSTAVGLVDASSLSKLLVQGSGSLSFLQRVCCSEMNVPTGGVVSSLMLNDAGGIEADVTVTRLAVDKFLLVSAASQAVRDRHWLERSVRDVEAVVVTDMTSAWAVLMVLGPLSSQLLERATEHRVDFSSDAFPHGTSRDVYVGYSQLRVSRHSLTGQPGFDLLIPTEVSLAAYEALLEAAAQQPPLPVSHVGQYAMESLRVAAGAPVWGADLSPSCTPLEAGLAARMRRGGSVRYRGQDALERQSEQTLQRQLVTLVMEDGDDRSTLLLGGEPLERDGQLLGYVGSAAYAYGLQGSAGLVWPTRKDGQRIDAGWLEQSGVEWAVTVSGVKRSVRLSLRPPALHA